MKPYISVIIPVLNEEKYLPRLLKDLANQTEKDFEVIIVDAHSEDDTCKNAKNFENKLDLKIVQSKKRNLAGQRNLGARKAKGTYVIFLDADVHIDKNFIKQLISHSSEHKYLTFLPVHIPHSSSTQDEILYKMLSFFVEISHVTDKPFTYGPGAMFQKDFFHFLGGYDETVFIYEDHEIVQRARNRGVHAKLLQEVPIYFSMRRFRQEGRFNVMNKYLKATMYLLANGKVDKEVFDYEMGGSAKYLLKKKENLQLTEVVKKYFDKLVKVIEES